MSATTTTRPRRPPPGRGRHARARPPRRSVRQELSNLSPLQRERSALVGLSLAVLVVLLAHRFGDLLPETKLDLAVDPGRFLSRATHFWDASADFGRIQNQAVGYLWPMGPFFLLGDALGIPPWITQRLWVSILVVLALWGMNLVLRHLRVGTPSSRVVGAAVYALSPNFLSAMVYQSAAQVPAAALPWIVAPLLRRRSDGTQPSGAVWRSGLAVACVGAVNGAAAIIVMAIPAMWFLTRRRPFTHWRLAATWGVASLMGMAWWLGPLALQGRYGFGFTPYTETSELTTLTQSATEALRGTGGWLSYLVLDGRPLVAGARAMSVDRASIIATLLVAGAGMAGLLRRDLRERTWLVATALVGLVATGVAFVGPLDGFASGPARVLLDGVLVPLRNVQKFGALVRFPLAVGVAHILAVGRLPAWTRVGGSARAPRLALLAMVVAVLVPVTRAQQSGLSPDGSFAEVPDYWFEAVEWVDDNGDSRRTLLAPSSSFGEYTWGRPLDEPIQAISTEAWAGRNIIPLGGTGEARLIDELDRRLVNRQLGPGTSEMLSRFGVRYLLVRNDLDRGRIFSPAPGLLRASLSANDGLDLVAAFGPVVGRSLFGDQLTTEFGPAGGQGIRAIEVWQVDAPTDRVMAYPADATLAVNGGPEALFEVADAGILSGRATVMADAGSAGTPTAGWVVTDATRRRDVSFANVRDAVSYTLTPDQEAPGTRRDPIDRLDPAMESQRTPAELSGAAEIAASSYSLDTGTRYPGTQPWAAFDDEPDSAWYPATSGSPVGAWVEARFDEARSVPSVTIERPAGDLAQVLGVEISTDAGRRTARFGRDDLVTVALPSGGTRSVRVTIADAVRAGDGFASSGLSGIDLEGVDLERPIAPVAARPTWASTDGPPVLVFDRARTDRTNRQKRDEDAALDRTFVLDEGGSFDVALSATPRPGPELDALVANTRALLGAVDDGVTVSSVWEGLPAFTGDAAHDDDLTTSWVAAADDPDPSLTVTWDDPVTLSLVRVEGPGFPAEDIRNIRLDSPSGVRNVEVGADGVGRFAPLSTRSVTVTLTAPEGGSFALTQPRVSSVSEITFDTPVPPVRTIDDDEEVASPCGEGPVLDIDGTEAQTALDTTWGAIVRQEPVTIVACEPELDLAAGGHRIQAAADGAFSIDGVTLDPGGREPAAAARSTRVVRWGQDTRTVEVGDGKASILATTENANPGWTATYEGRRLEPIVIDGWRQGWELPEGTAGVVELTFAPGVTYRAMLAGGALSMLALVLASIGAVRHLVPNRLRRRRRPEPLVPIEGLRPFVVGAAAVVAVAAVAGPLCLLVPLLFLARRARVLTLVLGSAVALAGLATLREPVGSPTVGTGSFSALAQSAAALAIGALALGLLRGGGQPDEIASDPGPGVDDNRPGGGTAPVSRAGP